MPTNLPGVLLEDVLGHRILAEVQDGGGAWEEFGDLSPHSPLPLQLLGGVGVNVEYTGHVQTQPVHGPAHQYPQCEDTGRELHNLDNPPRDT